MTTATRTGVFKVERAEDGKKWTITEDGRHGSCPINWGQRKDAVEFLAWAKEQAEKVVGQGYYQPDPGNRMEFWVKIDGHKTDIVPPYELLTASERRACTIRAACIRWAAMQYFVERASA